MRRYFSTSIGIVIFLLFITSCKKEYSCERCNNTGTNTISSNRPPIAKAGADQTIILPINFTNLDGSASTDPDNNIANYTWTKISGPGSFTIVNANQVQTQLTNLSEGVYTIELKVTDGGGLFARDTIILTVVSIPPPSQLDNLFFFFPDPTSSLDNNNTVTISFAPPLTLVIVKIGNLPDGYINGMWCKNCSPICPISSDYYAEPDNYTSFRLPPGTYAWTAVTVTQNFNGYPYLNFAPWPASLLNFFSITHSTSGTVTILPNDNCVIKKIVF